MTAEKKAKTKERKSRMILYLLHYNGCCLYGIFLFFYIHMNSSRGNHSDHVFSFCLRLAFSCEKVVWKIKVSICGKRLTGMMEEEFFFLSLSSLPLTRDTFFRNFHQSRNMLATVSAPCTDPLPHTCSFIPITPSIAFARPYHVLTRASACTRTTAPTRE